MVVDDNILAYMIDEGNRTGEGAYQCNHPLDLIDRALAHLQSIRQHHQRPAEYLQPGLNVAHTLRP